MNSHIGHYKLDLQMGDNETKYKKTMFEHFFFYFLSLKTKYKYMHSISKI